MINIVIVILQKELVHPAAVHPAAVHPAAAHPAAAHPAAVHPAAVHPAAVHPAKKMRVPAQIVIFKDQINQYLVNHKIFIVT